jgi:hypothetical protein
MRLNDVDDVMADYEVTALGGQFVGVDQGKIETVGRNEEAAPQGVPKRARDFNLRRIK